jgi:hypothetical protein
MREVLADIQDGTFARRFIADQNAGAPEFNALRAKGEAHPIEAVGRELRKLFSWLRTADTEKTTSKVQPVAKKTQRSGFSLSPTASEAPSLFVAGFLLYCGVSVRFFGIRALGVCCRSVTISLTVLKSSDCRSTHCYVE